LSLKGTLICNYGDGMDSFDGQIITLTSAGVSWPGGSVG
jgi:hypothetical protein